MIKVGSVYRGKKLNSMNLDLIQVCYIDDHYDIYYLILNRGQSTIGATNEIWFKDNMKETTDFSCRKCNIARPIQEEVIKKRHKKDTPGIYYKPQLLCWSCYE